MVWVGSFLPTTLGQSNSTGKAGAAGRPADNEQQREPSSFLPRPTPLPYRDTPGTMCVCGGGAGVGQRDPPQPELSLGIVLHLPQQPRQESLGPHGLEIPFSYLEAHMANSREALLLPQLAPAQTSRGPAETTQTKIGLPRTSKLNCHRNHTPQCQACSYMLNLNRMANKIKDLNGIQTCVT